MSGWLARHTQPTRPWVLWGLFGLGLLCGMNALIDAFAWLPPTWTSTIVSLREDGSPWVLAAAVLAAAGADVVSGGSVMVAPWVARAGWPATLRQVGTMAAALFSGLALTGGVGLVVTAIRTEVGAPNWAMLLGVGAAMASWIAVGYVVGVTVPRGWNLLVALLAAGVLWVTPAMVGPPLQAVALVWGLDWPALGDRFRPVPAWFRVLFLAALSGGFVVVAARIGRRVRGVGAIGYKVTTALIMLPVVALGAYAVARQPALIERDQKPPTVCAEVRDESRVCVHQAHRRLAEPLAAATAHILDAAGHEGAVHVIERAVATDAQADRPSRVRGEITIVFDLQAPQASREALLDENASAVARVIAGSSVCQALPRPHGNETPLEIWRSRHATGALAAILVARSGRTYVPDGDDPAEHRLFVELGKLDHDALRAWVGAHRAQIETCTLDADADTP